MATMASPDPLPPATNGDEAILSLLSPPPLPCSCLLALDRDMFYTIVGFLRPQDIGQLAQTSHEFQALELHARIASISGKFRSSDRLIQNLHLCTALQVLDLRGNKLTSDAIKTLARFLDSPSAQRLEILDVSAMSLTPLGVFLLTESLRRSTNGPTLLPPAPGRRVPSHLLPPLKTLALPVNNVGDEGAVSLGNLLAGGLGQTLESINLSNTVIGPRGLAQLARGLEQCRRLTTLNLSNNPLDVQSAYIQHAPNVQMPPMNDNGYPVVGLPSLVQSWDDFAKSLAPSLRHLSIYNSLLSATAVRSLVSHWRVPALLHLNLSWSRMGSDGARLLARSFTDGCCTSLQHLNLSHCLIHRDALPELTLALGCPGVQHSLRVLNLGWNPLNTTLATVAEEVETGILPVLLAAAVDEGQPPQQPMRAFSAAVASCPQLETVVLSNVKLGAEGARDLVAGFAEAATVAAPSCRSITTLNLSWNAMTAAGMPGLALLFLPQPEGRQRVLPRLRDFDISYNGIGDGGAQALAETWHAGPGGASFPLPSHMMLHVIGNQITGCTHHYIHAVKLGRVLQDIATAAAAAAAAAAVVPSPTVPLIAAPSQQQRQSTRSRTVGTSTSSNTGSGGGAGGGGGPTAAHAQPSIVTSTHTYAITTRNRRRRINATIAGGMRR